MAFAILLLAMFYLQAKKVLINSLEVETLASGAVFFASITANLAFFAANASTDSEINVAPKKAPSGGEELQTITEVSSHEI